MRISRLFHTIRYLRPTQIAGQFAHRARRIAAPIRCSRMRGQPTPPWPGLRTETPPAFPLPAYGENRPEDILDGRMRFIGEERAVGWAPDWRSAGASLLWRYNLHYFDWLWTLECSDARRAATDWIANHPCRPGHVGWQPYPTSLRIMNWIGIFFGRFHEKTQHDTGARNVLWESLWRQCEWLAHNLETHLLGNHYLENGAALALAGSVFAGDNADRWLRIGTEIVVGQLGEQILPDGMHFERSPMYHARALYLCLILAACGQGAARDAASSRIAPMARALADLTHPDGGIALLNDSAHGIYHPPAALLEAAGHVAPTEGIWQLPDAGYYGARSGQTYVVADAGAVGPDYIPGHAHADIFSFEFSVGAQRVVVDGGTCGYLPNAMRAWCRSTRAHNTVEVAGDDQCEMWGAFRMARRGRPRDVRYETRGDGAFTLDAWHDAYRRLVGSPRHHRTFEWQPPDTLTIVDRLEAVQTTRGISRIHLAPECRVALDSTRQATVEWLGGRMAVRLESPHTMHIEDSVTCPRFGVREPSPCIAIPIASDGPELRVRLRIESP